jgi:hypothetical protein
MEDVALAAAIHQGTTGGSASRDEVFQALDCEEPRV